MEEHSAKLSEISVHLSRVLDEIGLNESTVKKRRKTYLYQENVQSVYNKIFLDISFYVFGSQSEGTTTPELNSDIDNLCCIHQFRVVQSLEEWTESQTNLLMLRERSAPGYCRLQLLKQDKPKPEETLPRHDFFTYDEFNRVILKNSFLDKFKPFDLQMNKAGPARILQVQNCCPTDMVDALMCTSRLEAIEKWAERKRRCAWPTASLIHKVVNEPFFLVPVGYDLSSTKSIEWRISTSLAERSLMFSLNMVQIKCYVTLKLLIKTFVTPGVGRSISSYHCKTALLYCMVSTEDDFWQEENLLQSITRCLEMLLAWVNDEFCPHFLIKEVNLFAGKVTSENKGSLQLILRWLIQTNVNSLLIVSMDGIGHTLKTKLGTKPNRSPILHSMPVDILLGRLKSCRQISICPTYPINFLFKDLSEVKSDVRNALTILNSRTHFSDKLNKKATERANKILSGFLGSLLASVSFGRHDIIPKEAIDLLDASATSDISSLLKQASVFYLSGDLEKVERLCKKIEGHFKRYIIYPVCFCDTSVYSSEQYLTMYTRKHEVRFSTCVVFSPHEINCVPQALRYDLFRGVGGDIYQRHKFDVWMFLAVIHCLPFLYFLQYLTYKDLGSEELRIKSLINLERCIREENPLMRHLETAWNLLGQCYEMEKQLGIALHCYSNSLYIRPRNNAANWLVPLLLYKMYTGTRVR